MSRPRPYIPIRVRLKVAIWQFIAAGGNATDFEMRARRQHGNVGKRELLTLLLKELFPGAVAQLDHDPALILRSFDPETGRYTPDANDLEFLIWREKAAHQEKTSGRRPGARRTITTKGSDIGLKTKFARLEGEPKPKANIPSRRFQRRSTAASIAASKRGWKTRRKMSASRGETKPED